ncbi:MAG: hypothetical protein ACLSH6_01025 [Limosilactobacillus pontis]
MSNTSNAKTTNKKTVKKPDEDKIRVIVGEIGRDSKTGILGRGYSYDNGKTFHVTDTMYGRLYDTGDIDAIWNNGGEDRLNEKLTLLPLRSPPLNQLLTVPSSLPIPRLLPARLTPMPR